MATPNTLFAIFGVSDAPAVEAKLQNIDSWVYLKVDDGQWFLIAPNATTTKEVSDKLGFTGSEPGMNGIVLRVENYFGRTFRTTWEWVSIKQGAELGAQAV